MTIKTLDTKGRVTLGAQLAGQMVLVDDSNPACILIKPVVMIPADEAWLYKNPAALDKVRAGLNDARQGNFAPSPPDVQGDLARLADVDE